MEEGGGGDVEGDPAVCPCPGISMAVYISACVLLCLDGHA